jgi:MFS family permease
LLAGRRLRFVLAALAASGAADGFGPVTLSFAVLRVTGSVSRLGLVLAAQATAALALTLAGGLAADRFPRARILICSLAGRTAAAVLLAVTLLTGTASFPLLLAAAAGYGFADGFFGPASTALVPDLVPRDRLAPANALLGGAASTAAIAAPALAGLVVAVLGPGAGFAVQAVLLAAAAGSLRTGMAQATEATRVVRRRGAKDAKGKDAEAKDAGAKGAGVARHRGALRVGWGEFVRIRWLWLLTGQWLVFSMLTLAPVTVLGPALAQRYLGGAAAWGVISASLALGAVGGQFGAGRIRPPARPGLAVACLMPVMTAEALALGLGAPLAAVAAAAVVTGLAMGVQTVFFRTAMQTSVRPDVLARVAAIDLVGSEGGQPVGYALAGPLAAVTGAHAFLTASAAVMAVAGTAFTFVPALRTDASAGPRGERRGASGYHAPFGKRSVHQRGAERNGLAAGARRGRAVEQVDPDRGEDQHHVAARLEQARGGHAERRGLLEGEQEQEQGQVDEPEDRGEGRRQAQRAHGQHHDDDQPGEQEEPDRGDRGGRDDGEPAVVQAEHEHRVAQPERAEDAEHGGHRALAEGGAPDRGHEQAEGGGGQDDREGGAEHAGRHHADQAEAERHRAGDEAAQPEDGRVAGQGPDYGGRCFLGRGGSAGGCVNSGHRFAP